MFKTESKIKSLLADHLKADGFKVHEEITLPERYRVDLLAIKENQKHGIEVKTTPRGMSDDINKATILHRLPEFDYFSVAAPKIIIPDELLDFAKRVKVGVIGIEEEGIKWLQESELLENSQLLGGARLPKDIVSPGDSIDIHRYISIHGGKVVRNLEMHFIPSGPFITYPKRKYRFKRKKLEPGELPWEETFKIKVKKTAREGTYPLYITCTAADIQPAGSVFYIKIIKSME